MVKIWKFQIAQSSTQILLHGQQDIPSVQDNGFGVSPGFHALASVGYSVVLV